MNFLTRQDEDPHISVDLTDDDNPYCVRIDFGVEPDTEKHSLAAVNLHIRSAIDLHRKLGLALADWIATQAVTVVDQLLREPPYKDRA